jgi:hypothetical protein
MHSGEYHSASGALTPVVLFESAFGALDHRHPPGMLPWYWNSRQFKQGIRVFPQLGFGKKGQSTEYYLAGWN